MTEKETFDMLRKHTFNEVYALLNDRKKISSLSWEERQARVERILADSGWTIEEYTLQKASHLISELKEKIHD